MSTASLSRDRGDSLALGAFVLSLLWIFGLGSLAGLVLGIVSVRRSRRDRTPASWWAVAAIVIGAMGLVAALGSALVTGSLEPSGTTSGSAPAG
jgi:hypothetical protein